LLRLAQVAAYRRSACKQRRYVAKMRDDPRGIHFYRGQIGDPFFRDARRRAVRGAQRLRQIAQPADLIEPFVLFDDCAEEGRLSGQPLFESPDTDHYEYFASVRQAGVDFGAGGQILPRPAWGIDLLTTFGQLPDHASLRADGLAEPARKGAVGQRLVEFGSGHLLRRRYCPRLERSYLD